MQTGLSEKPKCDCSSIASCVPCCDCRVCLTTPPCIDSCAACRTTPLTTCWENRCADCAAVRAAADAGLAQHAVSTYFIRRVEQHTGGKTHYKHFLKWLIVVDVDRQIILAQRARQGPWCDTRALPGLVDAASRTMPIGVVLADAEFDSEANHRYVRGTLGAHSVIPPNPRRGIPEAEFRHQMYRAFPRQLYGPRAKIETVFSVIKRKLSTKTPGRSLPMQMRQALLLGLAFNLYRLRHRLAPIGCKQSHLQSLALPCTSFDVTGHR